LELIKWETTYTSRNPTARAAPSADGAACAGGRQWRVIQHRGHGEKVVGKNDNIRKVRVIARDALFQSRVYCESVIC
ncbi:MAG: hypothetical protein ACUVT8_03825, partial [Armatimonadota bacterium]